MGFPFFGQQPTFGSALCGGSIGLGGKTMNVPLQYPINMQYVGQQVASYLSGRGFEVNPMISQNMAVIQARHSSLLGYFTDSNKSYTIRICQGQGSATIETGVANWIQDLVPLAMGGGFSFFSDDMLHNKLLSILGLGGTAFDAYHVYQQYTGEDQLLNYIAQIVSSAPPAQGGNMGGNMGGFPPQGGFPPY
ncbi:hypothetical protein [Sulfuracidifex tepidarius]|uniref:Uncharacterized protein n=1 Tax=Sulfuracidifex tepidarius TaxID=1294262 RepID=A0A510DXK8_9CREN|nr:hypothetical protein [Sulfuracidifex tepidarius]BBG24909.1 hypothetical protein IC006_2243 [Sulfuracidifex tepidarius]BBG27695.1 hypothetical protein IC007_2249 [Sulfuracidifex tepidarius]